MKKWILLTMLLTPFFLMAKVNVIKQSEKSIFVQLTFENYKLIEHENYTHVDVENWEFNQNAGAPSLPQKLLSIIIPPDGDIKFNVLNIETEDVTLNKPILPVANIVRAEETSEYSYNIISEKYNAYPTEFIVRNNRSIYRRFEYIPIQFNPVLFDLNTNMAKICKSITLEIRIEGDTNYRNFIDDDLDELYSSFFANYESAGNWRSNRLNYHTKMPFQASDFWYKIQVDELGMYKLDFDVLSELPDFCDPNSLQMFTMYRTGEPQNYQYEIAELSLLINDENNIIDENDEVYFENQDLENNRFHNYSQEKFVWLTFGAQIENTELIETDFQTMINVKTIEEMKRKTLPKENRQTEIKGVLIYPEAGVFESHCDELIALHPEFPDSALIKKSQAEIFAEYTSGTADSWAIRFYLEDLYNANPELQYCTLMGSGTTEWDNTHEKNKIIAFANSSTSWAADDNFCLFNNFPALAMGRLPAQNEADMNFIIDRITTYTTDPTPGFWKNKVLIQPDDENKSGGYEGFDPNSGLNHTSLTQQTAELLNPEIYVDKVMAVEYEFDEFQNKPEARMAMVNSVNEGRLIWYYIGHGNEDVLGDEDYFRGSQHMNLLDNEEHLPLFIAASCEVGKFNYKAFDCLAEKLLLYEDGGSIASIAATSSCSGGSNTLLMKHFLQNELNDYPRKTIGESLLEAKVENPSIYANSKQYNILGDPMMIITVPHISGTISGINNQLQARQLVQINGDFGSGNSFTNNGELRVFEPEEEITYVNNNFVVQDTLVWTVTYTKEGNNIYFGENEIENGQFSGEFFVPDDVQDGNSGVVYNYYFDELSKQNFASALADIDFSSIPINASSISAPTVNLFIDSKTFASGDYVSTDPLIMAEIQDENGINITGAAGHKMLVLIDDSIEPIDVTEGFAYNVGSATSGELSWQLFGLEEGIHKLTLIVFDNFNNPTVAETNFRSKKSGKVAIKQMLPYPNPMKSDGYFTFVITEESDVTIMIYTITGKKIKTIKAPALSSGYNQIYWDGKDGDGDEIANNTYFYKIKAKQLSNKKVTEEIGKLIILK
ncbi:MAG: hypothetical protein K9N09_11315 [Candidatus Cloacimonetes bacterium]|nr:hypothetical protein [Candidatus Cloacimonadota bacterium]MCF7815025.1 hypothetical protein [Candidatus Cloacimonadota bacterium]MCF7869273.1 hypothetical protein [Candidatus Cloacimonadota bacterium]MCF7884701.1 hypothetical protein [Candidatus Cloacimonadota bacterium]